LEIFAANPHRNVDLFAKVAMTALRRQGGVTLVSKIDAVNKAINAITLATYQATVRVLLDHVSIVVNYLYFT
jgi:hypothetical protein